MEEVNPGFDFSGLREFWAVADLLGSGREPATGRWDALFSSPGYRALTASEFSRGFLVTRFRQAFGPAGEAGEPADRFVRHYRRASACRDLLARHERWLRQTPLAAPARDLARAWLPELDLAGYPPVAFLIFDNDGRGYVPVVIDLLAAREWGERFILFLAHEYHHFYRNRLVDFSWAAAPGWARDLLWVVNQLNLEGIADQVDKTVVLSGEGAEAGSEWSTAFRREMAGAHAYLELLDRELRAAAGDCDRLRQAGAMLGRALPSCGHPTGYAMARLILEVLGKEALVGRVADPAGFLRSYGVAAVAAGRGNPLSEAGLAVVEQVLARARG